MHEAGSLTHRGREILYRVVRSAKRYRTVALSVKEGLGLRILAPARISPAQIADLLRRRAGWILRQLDAPPRPAPLTLVEGAAFPYLGKTYWLTFNVAAALPRLADDRLEICGDHPDFTAALRAFYEAEALSYMQPRLDFWAHALKVKYKSFALSNASRLWGSCNAKNAIRINWRIIMAPPEVIDYLLVHELCHIANKNHGARFWQKVAAHLPDYRQRQKTLRAVEKDLLTRIR